MVYRALYLPPHAWGYRESAGHVIEPCQSRDALHLYISSAALQEAKITLVRLFQQYTFELKPGQEPLELRNTITLSPKKGVIVKPIPHKAGRAEE